MFGNCVVSLLMFVVMGLLILFSSSIGIVGVLVLGVNGLVVSFLMRLSRLFGWLFGRFVMCMIILVSGLMGVGLLLIVFWVVGRLISVNGFFVLRLLSMRCCIVMFGCWVRFYVSWVLSEYLMRLILCGLIVLVSVLSMVEVGMVLSFGVLLCVGRLRMWCDWLLSIVVYLFFG